MARFLQAAAAGLVLAATVNGAAIRGAKDDAVAPAPVAPGNAKAPVCNDYAHNDLAFALTPDQVWGNASTKFPKDFAWGVGTSAYQIEVSVSREKKGRKGEGEG